MTLQLPLHCQNWHEKQVSPFMCAWLSQNRRIVRKKLEKSGERGLPKNWWYMSLWWTALLRVGPMSFEHWSNLLKRTLRKVVFLHFNKHRSVLGEQFHLVFSVDLYFCEFFFCKKKVSKALENRWSKNPTCFTSNHPFRVVVSIV